MIFLIWFINSVLIFYYSALHIACDQEFNEIVEVLLNFTGIDINQQTILKFFFLILFLFFFF